MRLASVSPCCFSGSAVDLDLNILENNDLERPQAERYISDVFVQAYGANVTHFLPQIMALKSPDQRSLAALGLHFAQSRPLFLEQYLDVPVEQAVAAAAQTAVARTSIVELGNLASLQRGGLRCLIVGLTAYLKGAGVKWATFTAVPAVRNAFVKMGIPLYELGPARPERLAGDVSEWGTYYDYNPCVLAGNVEAAYGYLAEALHSQSLQVASRNLWEGAYELGRERAASHKKTRRISSLIAGC